MAKNSNTLLALGVGLNLDPLNQDFANAAKAAKEGMAVVGQSVVDGGSKASGATEKLGDKVQTMRQQLRLATQDAQAMAEKYGIMSTQAIASASKAGELKDKIGDINTVITAFSADSKFTVLAGALQSAAGAASIVTGSMALLGVESKDTQAMLLKVQGALALTQGLAQIKEMGASFTALRAVIVGQVIPSIAAMGVTMNIALGVIGLLAVGVGAMVIYYNNVSDATEKYRLELERTVRVQALQLQLFKTLQEIQNRGLNERNQALATENAIYEKNKQTLIQQLVAVEAIEKASGGRRSFQRNIVNSAIEENYKIHKEQTLKINNEFDKKELDAINATNKEKIAKQEAELKAALVIANKKFKDLGEINKKISTSALVSAFAGPKDITGEKDANGLPAPKFIPITYKIKAQIDKQTLEASIKEATENIKTQIAALVPSIKSAVVGVVSSALSGIGEGIAGALSGDDDPFADFGANLVKSLGQMAVQLGQQLLAIGAAMMFIPSLQAAAGSYLLGGAALIVAGSVVSGLAGRKSKGSTTPSPSGGGDLLSSNMGNNSKYIGGQNSGQLVISGYVRGNDINFVNGKSGSKNNRNLRFG